MDDNNPVGQGSKFYRKEFNRLASLDKWKWQDIVKKEDLAREGFYLEDHTMKRDRVRCVFCEVVLFNWEVGDNIRKEHERNAPRCPFVLDPIRAYGHNEPIESVHRLQWTRDLRRQKPGAKVVRDSDIPTIDEGGVVESTTDFTGDDPEEMKISYEQWYKQSMGATEVSELESSWQM